MSGARRGAIIVVLMAASLLVARGVAYAHAMLVSSDPAADSVLPSSPSRVRLVFSEPVEPTLASVSLLASDRRVVRLRVAGDPHDVYALIAPVTALAAAAYRLTWHVVSADGHPVGGSFVFWIGSKTASIPAPTADDDSSATVTWGPAVGAAPAVPALLQGLAVGCAMAVAGMLFFLVWTRRVGEAIPARAVSLTRLLVVAAPVLFALHFIAWLLNASPNHRLTNELLSAAFASGVARVELGRLAMSVLALWALRLARRPAIAVAFAIAVVLLSGATGHSAAIQPFVATPAKALHLLAASAWMGGLLWLLTGHRGDATRFASDASRMSTVALWSAVAVAASGVAMGALFLSSPRDLISSVYGAVMVGKIAGLVILIGFGAYHRFRVLPSLPDDPSTPPSFAVTLRRELAVMVAVVLLGGWLAYVPPPHAPPLHPSSTHSSVE
jgi:copper transport protein